MRSNNSCKRMSRQTPWPHLDEALCDDTQGEWPPDKQKKMNRTKQAKLNGRISSGKRE